MTHDAARTSSSVSRRAALAGLGAGGLGLAFAVGRPAGAQEATTTPGSSTAANLELVGRLVAAISAGDPSEMDELLSPDYEQHQPGVPPGREGFQQFIAAIGASPLQVLHAIAERDLVMTRSIIRGAAPSDPPALELFDLFRVAGGQVAEHWGRPTPRPVHRRHRRRDLHAGSCSSPNVAHRAEDEAMARGDRAEVEASPRGSSRGSRWRI